MSKKTTMCKRSSIGGQAVMEGVMMRGVSSMATAVRDADGIIRVESSRITPIKKRNIVYRLPIIRGVINFFETFVTGTKTLMRSAEVYGEEEPSNFEKWLSKKFKINLMSVVVTLASIIGVGLALLLFVFLPGVITDLIIKISKATMLPILKNLMEGGIRLLIFISYILLVSLLKDIKRTFMYHGAEHKVISCYEKGMELNVENARTCSTLHNRCGTAFMFFVMIISIIVFSLTGWSGNWLTRFLIRIALLPLVAGLSYELLKLLAKSDSKWLLPLKAPGLLLQKITTKEPTDDMLEVSLTAFKTVMAMDDDESIPAKKFVTSEKLSTFKKKLIEEFKANGIDEEAEVDWTLSEVLELNRDELANEHIVKPKQVERIDEIKKERFTGRPLWYVLGKTNFYGYDIKVDERVLIPRPETELLCEEALKLIKKEDSVLDLCSGSGCIAITIKKKREAIVTAVDISTDALEVAKENAKLNDVEIEFIKSDYFSELGKRKFSMIISNPPYIKTKDILSLQREVKDFEPTLALDGGTEGYDAYIKIAKYAHKYLYDGGVLLLEVGEGQAETVKKMLTKFTTVEIKKDLNGIERIIKAIL